MTLWLPFSGRLVQIAEEHVLDAIAGVEHARHDAPRRLFQRIAEHRLALVHQVVGLCEKVAAGDDAFVQRPRVLRHPERRIQAEQLRQVGRVERRMADGQRGLLRIDLNRRDIQRKLGFGLRHQKARDTVYPNPQRGVERQPDPGSVFSRRQRNFLPVNVERRLRLAVERNLEGNRERRAAFDEAVFGALQYALDMIAGALQRIATAAFVRGFLEPRTEMREAALRTAQIRRAHRRELPAVELVGRKRNRHADDGRANALFPEQAPERTALASHFDVRPSQRDAEASQFCHAGRLVDSGRGQFRNVRLHVPIQKIEDVVSRRADASRESGPGDRRQRRKRGPEPPEGTLLAQPREVRKQSLLHVPLGQAWIQTVESEEDHALHMRIAESMAAPEQSPGHAQRPH